MRNYLRLSQVLSKVLIQLSRYNDMTLLRFCHSAACHVFGLLALELLLLSLLSLSILYHTKNDLSTLFYDFS